MWTSQTSMRYVWEAEPGVPDEFPDSLVTPATSYKMSQSVKVKFSSKYTGCKRHRYKMSI